MMPKRVKRRWKIVTDDGEETDWEEYLDFLFPEDEAARPNLKLLQMAKLWRKQREETTADSEQDAEPSTGQETSQGAGPDVGMEAKLSGNVMG